jgi:hypothetical protein
MRSTPGALDGLDGRYRDSVTARALRLGRAWRPWLAAARRKGSAVDLQLDGKVALATWASKGIGRQVAGRLAAQGTGMAITARMPGPLDLTARETQPATGRRVLALPADMYVAAGVADINLASPRASFIDGARIPVDGAQRKAIMDRYRDTGCAAD